MVGCLSKQNQKHLSIKIDALRCSEQHSLCTEARTQSRFPSIDDRIIKMRCIYTAVR